MNNKYPYIIFPSVIPEATYRSYTYVGLNMIKENKDMNVDTTPTTYAGKDLNQRKGEVAFLQDKELFDLCLDYVFQANEGAGWNYMVDCTEALQFTHYKEGDFCNWHSDGGSDHNAIYQLLTDENKDNKDIRTTTDEMHINKVRKITVSINLSDGEKDYKGGDLFIRNLDGTETCIEEFRKPGSVVVFPSYTQHRISEVTSGNRYSIVLWCLGHPFR